MLPYLRYNVDLSAERAQKLDPSLSDFDRIDSQSTMDPLKNMKGMHNLGVLTAELDIK